MPPSNIGAPPSDREASTSGGSRAALEAVFRTEYPRLVAGLARMVGDLGLAQELAQNAVVAALEQWPISGVPRNCGAWLMAIGKRRAVDLFRRNQNLQRKYAELGRSLDPAGRADPIDPDTALDNDLGDDLLRLAFTTCHPVLGVPSRVALTLRLLGGLTTQEIARAYLVPEATIAQRIVRAKKTLTTNKVPFEVPRGKEFLDRLPSVLEVLYLIFNEGYSATSSGDWMRPALCEDALRLGRILIGLVPDESEALGLVALMEIQAHGLRPARARTASRCCCWIRTGVAGTMPLSNGVSMRCIARRCSPRALAAMRCRRPSPRATPAHPGHRTPIGSTSPVCTPLSPRSSRHR